MVTSIWIELSDANTAVTDVPRHPSTEGLPEEAARLMFHHSTQLNAPVGYKAAETNAGGSRLPGHDESVAETESVAGSLRPRIA